VRLLGKYGQTFSSIRFFMCSYVCSLRLFFS
jgi:hypothetical protein